MKLTSFFYGIVFCFAFYFPNKVLSNESLVSPGDAFYIKLADGASIPLLIVNERLMVVVFDGVMVDLNNVPVGLAKEKLATSIEDTYKVLSVDFVSKDRLVKVSILGDVNIPGNYWVPKDTGLNTLDKYNDLFDHDKFDAKITLIRSGFKTSVTDKISAGNRVQPGDTYLISLSKKKPKPKVVKKPDPLPKADTKSVSVAAEAGESKKEIKAVASPADSAQAHAVTQQGVLKPGDILTIGLSGEEGFNTDFLIDRDGSVTLPEVGALKVSGLPLDKAEEAIYKGLSVAFLGLDKLTVKLKEGRLLVSVLGYVAEPGEVDLPSNGNVQMAINKAGGLQAGAQLDKLQLQRNGETLEFNFKQYLDSGDASLIPDLQPLDVIFIPSSSGLGAVHGEESVYSEVDKEAIKVFGEVINPGIFSFSGNMNLVDALLKAGGVTRYANVEQIRVIDKGEPTLFNLKSFLDNGDESKLKVLSMGATVFVPKQVDAVQGGGRVVYVMGQVQKPGGFEIGNNVGFLDVLANAGGPNRYADTRAVRILRANGDVVPFNLQDYAEGYGGVVPDILPGDAIFISEKGEDKDQGWLSLQSKNTVKLIGAIKKPGRYEWVEQISFMDLIAHAGGPTDKADMSNIRIIAPDENGDTKTTVFNMKEFIANGGSWSLIPKLQGGSTIVFTELPQSPTDIKGQWTRLPKEQAIYLLGAFNKPGRYAFNDDVGFLDVLSASDGPSKDADLSKVRIVHRTESKPVVSHVNLVDFFETGDVSLLPELRAGDSIYIPSMQRNWTEKKSEDTVRVLGAVTSSGRYDFINEMTILDLLAEAGGPTKTAYIEKIIIVNTSCCKNQAYTFDLMEFMKKPDASRLPVLRAGDTVYVPDTAMSYWSMFMDAIKNSLSVLSLLTIVKGL